MRVQLVDIPAPIHRGRANNPNWQILIDALRTLPIGKAIAVDPQEFGTKSRGGALLAKLYSGMARRGVRISGSVDSSGGVAIWYRSECEPAAPRRATKAGYRRDSQAHKVARDKVSPQRRREIALMGSAARKKKTPLPSATAAPRLSA